MEWFSLSTWGTKRCQNSWRLILNSFTDRQKVPEFVRMHVDYFLEASQGFRIHADWFWIPLRGFRRCRNSRGLIWTTFSDRQEVSEYVRIEFDYLLGSSNGVRILEKGFWLSFRSVKTCQNSWELILTIFSKRQKESKIVRIDFDYLLGTSYGVRCGDWFWLPSQSVKRCQKS